MCGEHTMAVPPPGKDAKRRVLADGIGVVVVVTLPCVVVIMEDEMSREEECIRPNFTPLGNPLAMQLYSQLRPWQQDWRVELV